MTIHTVPSRDFARDLANAKRMTAQGPVFITNRGKPAFALLKIEDYYRLNSQQEMSLLELMDNLPRADGIKFDAARSDIALQIPELD
ncbi:MAG: type II toxin-antitoxin system prevent-host-death family antitoxin [Methylobacillus sp.]|jgi:prevent-host-death family protein|nr:type II toxin-antitoxin system prevent-host-death family antitoxin [Methylobacillus sp.]